MIVLDASVLTAAVAVTGLEALPSESAYHAPDVIELETLNALRRLLRRQVITPVRAAAAIEDMGAAPISHHPTVPLRDAIWALRDNLSAYDAAYVALAASLPGSTLLTADASMAEAARGVLGPERVRLLV